MGKKQRKKKREPLQSDNQSDCRYSRFDRRNSTVDRSPQISKAGERNLPSLKKSYHITASK